VRISPTAMLNLWFSCLLARTAISASCLRRSSSRRSWATCWSSWSCLGCLSPSCCSSSPSLASIRASAKIVGLSAVVGGFSSWRFGPVELAGCFCEGVSRLVRVASRRLKRSPHRSSRRASVVSRWRSRLSCALHAIPTAMNTTAADAAPTSTEGSRLTGVARGVARLRIKRDETGSDISGSSAPKTPRDRHRTASKQRLASLVGSSSSRRIDSGASPFRPAR
jgi:hypothetical protein